MNRLLQDIEGINKQRSTHVLLVHLIIRQLRTGFEDGLLQLIKLVIGQCSTQLRSIFRNLLTHLHHTVAGAGCSHINECLLVFIQSNVRAGITIGDEGCRFIQAGRSLLQSLLDFCLWIERQENIKIFCYTLDGIKRRIRENAGLCRSALLLDLRHFTLMHGIALQVLCNPRRLVVIGRESVSNQLGAVRKIHIFTGNE